MEIVELFRNRDRLKIKIIITISIQNGTQLLCYFKGSKSSGSENSDRVRQYSKTEREKADWFWNPGFAKIELGL